MNELTIAQKAVNEATIAAKQANQQIVNVFYPGREIVFRRGNMKENHNAVVVSAGYCSGHPWIRIHNVFTGKDRDIHLDDVKGLIKPAKPHHGGIRWDF